MSLTTSSRSFVSFWTRFDSRTRRPPSTSRLTSSNFCPVRRTTELFGPTKDRWQLRLCSKASLGSSSRGPSNSLKIRWILILKSQYFTKLPNSDVFWQTSMKCLNCLLTDGILNFVSIDDHGLMLKYKYGTGH